MSEIATDTGLLRGPLRKRESSLWARHPEDWYVEPSWCSERLFDIERFEGNICDPAMGQGHITLAAFNRGHETHGLDVVARNPHWPPLHVMDWLAYDGQPFDNIVSNPPFKLCDDRKAGRYPFVEQCLKYSRRKVALLMPANWVQGDDRSRWLETTPLRKVLFITPRPSMPPGDALAAGMKPGNGTTDYAWFIWLHGFDGRAEIGWLRRKP
ncbi:hypothetical protein [Aestuariivirga sp.]|uniref:hypothetical protein n=1 Tax=Aestuariivirga sp. TaxID=2650926 RepID=UPI0039E48D17